MNGPHRLPLGSPSSWLHSQTLASSTSWVQGLLLSDLAILGSEAYNFSSWVSVHFVI